MTARLVTFPADRARPPTAMQPIGDGATIIILPIVRVEHYDLAPPRPRPRSRRRRRIEITEHGEGA